MTTHHNLEPKPSPVSLLVADCRNASSILTLESAFYFNFRSSILGRLVPSVSSQSCPLPYRTFIATPLLPCGGADPKVKKFTGNDLIGAADDDMTKAIHAFAHFSTVYSSRRLLLCDLQGNVIYQLSLSIFPMLFE